MYVCTRDLCNFDGIKRIFTPQRTKIIKVEFVSMNKNKSKNYTNYFHTSLIYKRKGKSLNRITKNNSYFNDHNPLNIPDAL